MKTPPKAQLIRNTLLAATLISTILLPLFASASSPASTPNIKVAYSPDELKSAWGRKNVYERLQDASRELCGSSNVRITGSLLRAAAHEECYEGTLTAAVQRLDVQSITELHEQQSMDL